MGLDVWLMVKTKARQTTDRNSATGVCSGLFGCVPTTVTGAIELCYLRNGYDQKQLLCSYGTKRDGDDEDTLHYNKEDITGMLKEAKRILRTHRFDKEDGNDLTYDDPCFKSFQYTWISKSKWKNLVKGLEEALKILKEDTEADIYYHDWY